MDSLGTEISVFADRKRRRLEHGAQTAALQLNCGIDFDQALAAEPHTLRPVVARLQRLIERERLRGALKHWTYDLNRHIAMKQALDRLRQVSGKQPGAASKDTADPRLRGRRVKPISRDVP